jgi:hypothetical protein
LVLEDTSSHLLQDLTDLVLISSFNQKKETL